MKLIIQRIPSGGGGIEKDKCIMRFVLIALALMYLYLSKYDFGQVVYIHIIYVYYICIL